MRFEISEDEYTDMNENNEGFCIECGDIADSVEPDAHGYKCESCGHKKVYGLDELLLMGLVTIIED